MGHTGEQLSKQKEKACLSQEKRGSDFSTPSPTLAVLKAIEQTGSHASTKTVLLPMYPPSFINSLKRMQTVHRGTKEVTTTKREGENYRLGSCSYGAEE